MSHKYILCVFIFAIFVGACAPVIPDNDDFGGWCYTFDFVNETYPTLQILSGSQTANGLETDSGTLSIVYDHGAFIEISALESNIEVVHPGGGVGRTILAELNVFGLDKNVETELFESISTTLTATQQSAGNAGTQAVLQIATQADTTVYVESLTVVSSTADESPFGVNDCGDPNPTATNTFEVIFTPTATPSPTLSPTPSPTATMTTTPDDSYCYEWDFTVYSGEADGFTPGFTPGQPQAVHVTGEGWAPLLYPIDDGDYDLYLNLVLPSTATITRVDHTITTAGTHEGRAVRMYDDDDNQVLSSIFGPNPWTGSVNNVERILWSWNNGDSPFQNRRLTHVRVEGINDPFGGSPLQGYACDTQSPDPTATATYTPTPLSSTQTWTPTPTITNTPDPTWSCEVDFTANSGGWQSPHTQGSLTFMSTWENGTGWTEDNGDSDDSTYIVYEFSSDTNVDYFEFVVDPDIEAAGNYYHIKDYSNATIFAQETGFDVPENTFVAMNLGVIDGFYIGVDRPGGTTTYLTDIVSFYASGTGTNPFSYCDPPPPTPTPTITATPGQAWCHSFDFGASTHSFIATDATYESGFGWAVDTSDDEITISSPSFSDTLFNGIELTLSESMPGPDNILRFGQFGSETTRSSGNGGTVITLSVSEILTQFTIGVEAEIISGEVTYDGYITNLRIEGSGVDPFTGSDCFQPTPTGTFTPQPTGTPAPSATFLPTLTPGGTGTPGTPGTGTPFGTPAPGPGGTPVPGIGDFDIGGDDSIIDSLRAFFGDTWGFIRVGINLVTSLNNTWRNSPAIAPSPLPDCLNAPLNHNICAIYYIMEHTIFSGIGSFIIPILVTGIDMLILVRILSYIRTFFVWIREILS